MNIRKAVAALSVVAVAAMATGFAASNRAITKEGRATVVNTTAIASNIHGFKGATPVKIYIVKGKVSKIVPLPNHDTPEFFNRAKAVLKKFTGKSVDKAANASVDGVTGATYSSNGLIKTVKAGLRYYNAHK